MLRGVGALLSGWSCVLQQASRSWRQQDVVVLSAATSAAAGKHWLLLGAQYGTKEHDRHGESKQRSSAAALTNKFGNIRDVNQLAQLLQRHAADLDRIHIAAGLVAAARLRARVKPSASGSNHGSRKCVKLLIGAAGRELGAYQARELANMISALAKLECKDAAFLEQLFVCAKSKLCEFNQRELANTASALAKLQHVDQPFLEQLLVHAGAKLREFKPSELANTAAALAKLHQEKLLHGQEQFLEQLLVHAKPKLHDFSAQDLAITASALKIMGHVDKQFNEQMSECGRVMAGGIKGRGTGNDSGTARTNPVAARNPAAARTYPAAAQNPAAARANPAAARTNPAAARADPAAARTNPAAARADPAAARRKLFS